MYIVFTFFTKNGIDRATEYQNCIDNCNIKARMLLFVTAWQLLKQ